LRETRDAAIPLETKTMPQKPTNFIKSHRLELILLTVIFLLGAFLRLYQIGNYMTFLGDEGRDALVMHRILINHRPTLIGPTTSVTTPAGHMYLGPLYYYLMAIPMALTGLNPASAAVMVALFGLATLLLTWWTGRSWFNSQVGLIAALLYAISPTAIIYSHSSWNPNIMPFFALLGPPKNTKNHNFRWLIITAIALAFCLQSHYLGLLLVPTLGIIWLLTAIRTFKHQHHLKKKFILNSGFCILVFLFLMSPLVLFDLRHNLLNFNALKSFFTIRQTTVNLKIYKALPHLYPIFTQVIASLITAKNILLAQITTALITLTTLIYLLRPLFPVIARNSASAEGRSNPVRNLIQNTKYLIPNTISPAFLLIFTWIFIGLAGLGLYKQHLYDHYFGFLFPAIFLLTAWVINQIASYITVRAKRQRSREPKKLTTYYLLLTAITLPLIYLNLTNTPIKFPPNYQLSRTQQIAEKIIQESNNQPFNLAMIAKQNYDAGYRFILTMESAPLVAIDPQQADTTITDQLFVICENQPPFESRDEDCNPLGHPKAEIAHFGWANIEEEWTFPWGTTLYRLVHSQHSTNN
jgi:4-amino-4-deoxy-L-arabinose transferase-like glycosyltransferase